MREIPARLFRVSRNAANIGIFKINVVVPHAAWMFVDVILNPVKDRAPENRERNYQHRRSH